MLHCHMANISHIFGHQGNNTEVLVQIELLSICVIKHVASSSFGHTLMWQNGIHEISLLNECINCKIKKN